MEIFLYIVNHYLSQSVFIIGLVVVIGMIAMKRQWNQILPSADGKCGRSDPWNGAASSGNNDW